MNSCGETKTFYLTESAMISFQKLKIYRNLQPSFLRCTLHHLWCKAILSMCGRIQCKERFEREPPFHITIDSESCLSTRSSCIHVLRHFGDLLYPKQLLRL